MKNAFLSIKFHEDVRNKELIEGICDILKKVGIEVRTVIRDYEKWGKIKFKPDELMSITFKEIEKADMLIVEFSEKGVGLGIEAGYAYSKNKPIIILAKKGSDISTTISGISKQVIFYNNIEEVKNKIEVEHI